MAYKKQTNLRKRNMWFAIAFLFLALFSFVHAEECGSFGTYLKNGVCVPDILVNLSVIVMLISLSIASIFFMIGTAMQHTRIISWSKDLLFQLLGTAVILGIYLTIVATLDFWAPALLSTNWASPLDSTVRGISVEGWSSLNSYTQRYVGCLITYTNNSIKRIMTFTSTVSTIGSTSINLQTGPYSQYFSVFPTGGGLTSIGSIVIAAIAGTLVQLKIQLDLLSLALPLFNVILPLGLIFRSFPYTRTAGAAMIAIVIGFTIFLPIFYLLIEDIGYQYYNKNVCNESPPEIGFVKMTGFAISAAQNDVLDKMGDFFGEGGDFEGLVKILLIQATILPFVAYLVVLNITKRIAELMGGEIDFSTLVRLI